VSIDPLGVGLRPVRPIKFDFGELFWREMLPFFETPAFTSNGIVFGLPEIYSV
jgi:hypothetical protein